MGALIRARRTTRGGFSHGVALNTSTSSLNRAIRYATGTMVAAGLQLVLLRTITIAIIAIPVPIAITATFGAVAVSSRRSEEAPDAKWIIIVDRFFLEYMQPKGSGTHSNCLCG